MIAKVQPKGVAEHLLALALLIKVLKLKLYENTIFYKQLGSGLSCLYFQGFRGSKLLNGCLVV